MSWPHKGYCEVCVSNPCRRHLECDVIHMANYIAELRQNVSTLESISKKGCSFMSKEDILALIVAVLVAPERGTIENPNMLANIIYDANKIYDVTHKVVKG